MSLVLMAIRKKGCSYHPLPEIKQLRDSRIALWMEEGSARQAQYKAGFRSTVSLQRYDRQGLCSLKEAVRRFSPF